MIQSLAKNRWLRTTVLNLISTISILAQSYQNLIKNCGEQRIRPKPTQKAATSKSSTRPRKQRSISKTTILASLAVVLSVLIIGVLGWSAISNSSYPTEFSERPEVKKYVAKIQEFRNVQRELEIVSEAYVKSKSPPPEEREQIEAFNRSIKPLIDEDIKLTEALKLFKASQVDEAKATLVAATKTLHQKIPELQSRAKDLASKLR